MLPKAPREAARLLLEGLGAVLTLVVDQYACPVSDHEGITCDGHDCFGYVMLKRSTQGAGQRKPKSEGGP